jgi:hypothetical protein
MTFFSSSRYSPGRRPKFNHHCFLSHPFPINYSLIVLPLDATSWATASDVKQTHQTTPAMYVWRNIEARSCNHCCSGKAGSITYSECVSVALGIQHAMRMRHIDIWGLSVSTEIFNILLLRPDFRRKLLNIKCFHFFYNGQRICRFLRSEEAG